MSNYLLTQNNYQSTQKEQILYDYLQYLVRNQEPENLIDDFKAIFIDASEDFIPEIWQAMEAIIDMEPEPEDFHNIINRSCYILINYWLQNPRLQKSIPDLVNLFQEKANRYATCWTSQRIRCLSSSFSRTEQYFALQRLARILTKQVEENTKVKEQTLVKLINRYPYLYENSINNENNTDKERKEIIKIRQKQQQKYELDLCKYIIYQKLSRKNNYVKNPTLIGDKELNYTIQYFTGKINGGQTLRNQSEIFRSYCDLTYSYRSFKDGLYEYLTDTINCGYGKSKFNRKLYYKLKNTFSQNNSHQPNDSLMLDTCRDLLNFMVVESLEQPKHFVFYDLINNLGPIKVIGILLKIVLFCRQARPNLEEKFSILFNHYQGFNSGKVWWLVKCMEILNVALTTNFGRNRLCCL
ncbi:hypothetical protein [Okeania sp.]|uniref:hypothetical protein n=1 Tax=Okeania sp. TaxID=3100323 RepID=UPI002B4B1469|nr:hypothetical protein [Okeania sp.]MEB3342337.1 hypothetical protein [Okeania sp.]